MAKRIKKYEDSLVESLKDPKEAVAYLNAHLEKEEGDTDELFPLALRHVAKAFGFAEVAKSANLGRESLYKALSAEGNPKIETVLALLKAMGLKLSVEVAGKKRTA